MIKSIFNKVIKKIVVEMILNGEIKVEVVKDSISDDYYTVTGRKILLSVNNKSQEKYFGSFIDDIIIPQKPLYFGED